MEHHTDTFRFIAVSRDQELDDDDDWGQRSWSETGSLEFSSLREVLVKVWIFVDVLLLVRRLSLMIANARQIHHVQPAVMTSRDCVTWPSTVDQSQQPLGARQNGGPFCLPQPTIVADVTSSRDLSSPEAVRRDVVSPEVVRVLGDISLVYVAVTVGTLCLLAAALCACAMLLDHFLSAIARGSFLLPVTTLRSAVEFLSSEARHLSAASVSAMDQRYELTLLQQIIMVFNKGLIYQTLAILCG